MGKLNAKQVERAKHDGPGDFTILRDGDGLELRVRPSGVKSWFIRYQLQGKRRLPCLGEWPDLSLSDARERAEAMRRKLRAGIDPVEEARAEQEAQKAAAAVEQARLDAERRELEARHIFAPTVERWIELEVSRRKHGGGEMLRAFRKDIFPTLADRELGSIRRGDLADILDGIVARGSPVQANRTLASLKQFFNWCEAREWIDRNPLTGMLRRKVGGDEKERDRVLSIDELKELRDKMPAAKFERPTELAIWIMLSTLARVGEIIQARWEHVDLDAGTWRIPAGNSKNAKEHVIFLSEFARRQFEELRSVNHWSDWCMPSSQKEGSHVCLKSLSIQVRDRQRETPLRGRTKAASTLILSGGSWTPHDLRRTGATMMGDLGTLSEVIEKCLNHVEASKIKRTYQRHELMAERREAWQRLGARLDEVLNDKARKVIPIRQAATA